MLLGVKDFLVGLSPALNVILCVHICSIIFLLWRASKALCLYTNRPKGVPIIGRTLLIGQWLSVLDFIFRGANNISAAYKKAKRLPFAVPAIANYQVLVSSQEHVQELAQASEDILSFRKGMNERLFFRYTMGGFEFNNVDPHNSIAIRMFKTLARENLPHLSEPLSQKVAEVWKEFYDQGINEEGASEVTLNELSGRMIARMNNTILFGEELARDREFEEASIRYGWHSSLAMEIFRHTPMALVPFAAKIFMAWSGAMNKVGRAVQALVNHRVRERKMGTSKPHLDCIDWVISLSHTQQQSHPVRMAQQMMALLFASTHQMQMALTWIIVDLCLHPEYIIALREEIRRAFSISSGDPYDRMPLMECFFRESSRLNTIDGLNMQRKAMHPFTFSDGTHIPAGNLIAIPQREIMRDPANYASANVFDPHRFKPSWPSETAMKYTDVNWKYLFWGSPKMACPGRWYASYALKHAIVHLLTKYNLELLNPNAKKSFIWTTAIVPRSDIRVILHKR